MRFQIGALPPRAFDFARFKRGPSSTRTLVHAIDPALHRTASQH